MEKNDCYPAPYGCQGPMMSVKAEKDMSSGHCHSGANTGFDFSAANSMMTPKDFNFKSLFNEGTALVKQEDSSELAQYGFPGPNGAWPNGAPNMFHGPGGAQMWASNQSPPSNNKPEMSSLSPVNLSNGHQSPPQFPPYTPSSNPAMFLPPNSSYPATQFSSQSYPVYSQGFAPQSFNPAAPFSSGQQDFPPSFSAPMSQTNPLFPNTFGPRPPNST
eukprot:GHVU01020169.1.p1 GENE.GHVU01020169.1~~GHVU01020169.1.p1  ORF type:complete len:226 (-),score=5.86 GHVU01020169.1:227-877(-)